MGIRVDTYKEEEEFFSYFIQVTGPMGSVLVFNHDGEGVELAHKIVSMMEKEESGK